MDYLSIKNGVFLLIVVFVALFKYNIRVYLIIEVFRLWMNSTFTT